MAYEDRIMRMAANRRRNEGIANPHIRERRLRSLRTPSEQTIGPVGRGPLSTAEAAYHRGNVGTFVDDPFQGSLTKSQRGMFESSLPGVVTEIPMDDEEWDEDMMDYTGKFADLLRKVLGFNRGGIASLPYAR